MLRKKRNRIILAIAVFAVSIMVFFSVIFLNRTIEEREFYAKLEVSNISGFDLNSSALTFGLIMPGNSASRNLIIENNYGFPIMLVVSAIGKIERFLMFEKIARVNTGERKVIGISAVIPDKTKYDVYEGKVIIRIKKDI